MIVSAELSAAVGLTLAARFHNSYGLTWNVAAQAWQAESSANVGNCSVTMTDANSVGRYATGNVTVGNDTAWSATIFEVAGGNYTPVSIVPDQATGNTPRQITIQNAPQTTVTQQ